MKRRPPLKLSFDYMDTPERRVLSLEPDGILCMPVIGFDCYRKKWQEASLHVHDECLEISLCLRGDLTLESNGKTYPFKPGVMFATGPEDVHRIRSYPKGMSKYWFLFRIPKDGFPLLNLPPKEAESLTDSLMSIVNRPFAGTDEVKRLFKKLFSLCDTLPSGTSERSLRLRSVVLALLLAVVDAASATSYDRAEVRLSHLVEEMREHPERAYPLDRISESLGFSPSNLLVRFKRLTGLPPHAFLLQCRIDRAKTMLAEGVSVGSVAHQLGFSSSQHFSSQFKAVTGFSPAGWR
jgi:AraC-like DNA-binding protein/mannose-6-phosphate isomerase-like protein (cupin superfamily)